MERTHFFSLISIKRTKKPLAIGFGSNEPSPGQDSKEQY
jgi:hypothetical protein